VTKNSFAEICQNPPLDNRSRNIRTCIITQYFPPDMGAASSRALNLASALTNRGHSVNVLTAFPHYPHGNIPEKYKHKFILNEKTNKLNVCRVWVPPLSTEGLSKRLIMYLSFVFSYTIALFALRDFDFYFYVSPYGASFLSLPAYVHSRLNKGVFAIDQGDPWPDVAVSMGYIRSKLFINVLESMVRIMYRTADAICPISAVIGEWILRYGADKQKVHVIELGVDTNVFKPLNKLKLSVWGSSFEGKFIIEYSGIFGPIYDFDSMLKAAKLLEPMKDILFLIRGDGELESEILRLIQTLSLKNIVVRGRVNSPREVSEYLNVADVLLIPLKKEKVLNLIYPYKVIEYLACGKPIIVCAEGALAELVSNAAAGIVVQPENPAALARAILQLYNDYKQCEQMSANSIKVATNHFSFAEVGKKLEQVFMSIECKS
jgi:glycosyltransferase involved in cell wall biosynthesis